MTELFTKRKKRFIDKHKVYYVVTKTKKELPNHISSWTTVYDIFMLSTIITNGDWINIVKIDQDSKTTCGMYHKCHEVDANKITVIKRMRVQKFLMSINQREFPKSDMYVRVVWGYLDRLLRNPYIINRIRATNILNSINSGDVFMHLIGYAVEQGNLFIFKYCRRVGVMFSEQDFKRTFRSGQGLSNQVIQYIMDRPQYSKGIYFGDIVSDIMCRTWMNVSDRKAILRRLKTFNYGKKFSGFTSKEARLITSYYRHDGVVELACDFIGIPIGYNTNSPYEYLSVIAAGNKN